MVLMKVFVFEHLAGGIHAHDAAMLEPALLRQGGAMLQSAAQDFREIGAEVVTMMHGRAVCDMAGVQVHPVDEGSDIDVMFDELAAAADSVLVIAPESEGILEGWLKRVDGAGGISLGSSSDAAALCGDKLKFAHHLNVVNILTPPTMLLTDSTDELEYPIVVKPRDGAGCEDTFLMRGPEDLDRLPPGENWIVQPFVNGIDVSCSLMVHGMDVKAMPPGRQYIQGDSLMRYCGGSVGLEDELATRAMELAINAVSWVPGLHGYIGVDIVLGSSAATDRVIEINPRLTLSYIALKELCQTSMAAAMLDPDAPLNWRDDTIRFDAGGNIQPETAS
jgi:hypothetical protein